MRRPFRLRGRAPLALCCAALVLWSLAGAVSAGARSEHARSKPTSPPGHSTSKDVGKPDEPNDQGANGKKGSPPGRETTDPQQADGAERGDETDAGAALRRERRAQAVDPGDIQIDYVAAAQHTYDHSTGDGSADEYDSRSIGDKVVESLQGRDFRCGELATFFAALTVSDTATAGSATAELDMSWTAEPSGQAGAGFRDFIGVSVNDNDSGNLNLDGNESATLVSESTGEAQGKRQLFATISVSGLDPGDQVIVAMVVQIQCGSATPTGNLFARVQAARLVEPTSGAINVGAQTITLHRVEDLGSLPGEETATITITKDARPNAAQDFAFSGLGGFTLDDDLVSVRRRSRTFSGLAPRTYVVAELPTAGWRLTRIRCDDPTGDTTVSVAEGTATIALAAGDSVVCTYVNEAASGGSSDDLGAPSDEPLPLTGTGIDQLLGAALLFVGAGALLLRRDDPRRG
jgi:hypothetical protein